jgi:hypothetical protein
MKRGLFAALLRFSVNLFERNINRVLGKIDQFHEVRQK